MALTDAAERAAFWCATDDGQPPDAWRRGVSGAPALVVCLSNPAAYLDRYAEPDKARANLSSDPWPVPYWDTDTAMAVMVLLLAAEDAGLGALFFGVPGERHAAVREAFDIPDDRRLVGVVALGTEAARVSGSARSRPRRSVDDVLHEGRFGASREVPPGRG